MYKRQGDGWSTDGASIQKDYDIPWAIQYYGLLYSKLAADTDPRRAELYRRRAQLFAQQFVYWFDANGAALPFGRSLTYRFAQNSFWAACIWAGLEPLPLPVMKGLIVRNFNWWLEQKMFDRDGILTIGYCYPQMYMACLLYTSDSGWCAQRWRLPSGSGSRPLRSAPGQSRGRGR